MVTLNSKETNIKYIGINYYGGSYFCHNDNVINDINDWVSLRDFGVFTPYSKWSNTYNRYKLNPSKSTGIFLGNVSDIDNEINSKINPNSPTSFDKIYIDKCCKYPRFKISALTNIKKCLDPTKADSVIISQHNFTDYDGTIANCHLRKYHLDTTIIMYSKKADCYYFLDYYPFCLANSDVRDNLDTWIIKNSSFKESNKSASYNNLMRWCSSLINAKVLPNDCVEFYNGNVVLLKNDAEIAFINNLYNRYMKITYDTELDRFINNGIEKTTDEDLDTIKRMISSDDETVVGMGLKLLSNYDITSSICSIGYILGENYRNVLRSGISNSVGFKQVLATLSLCRDDLARGDINHIINKLYNVSEDKEDKEKVRKYVIDKTKKMTKNFWKDQVERKFGNLALSFNFTIE